MISVNERLIWFSQDSVKFEIVKHIKNKELFIKGGGVTVRFLRAAHHTMLDYFNKHFGLLNKPVTYYCSLTNYDFIPKFSFNLLQRKEQTRKWMISGERKKSYSGMDFGIDLDCKDTDYKDAYEELEKIMKLYDGVGVKYAFWMSGAHGFHIIIPYEEVIKAFDYTPTEQQLLTFYETLASKIKTTLKLQYLDESVYTATRVFKLPYGLTKDGIVILPLNKTTYQELKEEKLELTPLHVLKNVVIKNRGVYLNNKDSDKSFKNLIKKIEKYKND